MAKRAISGSPAWGINQIDNRQHLPITQQQPVTPQCVTLVLDCYVLFRMVPGIPPPNLARGACPRAKLA